MINFFDWERGDPRRSDGQGPTTLHSQTPYLPEGHLLPGEGLTRLKNNWILQLRAKALRAE